MHRHLRRVMAPLVLAVGLAAPVAADVQSRLNDIQAVTTVGAYATSRKTQLNCTTDRNGIPACEAVVTQYLDNGTLSTNANEYERHLAYDLASVNKNPRSPLDPRTYTAQVAMNPLVSDLAANTTQPYARIQLNGGAGTLEVNSLANGVSGASASTVGPAPTLDGLLDKMATGLTASDAVVLRVLNGAIRGVFLDGGVLTHARSRSYENAPGVYKMEIAPEPQQGRAVLILSNVVFAGDTPVSGTLSLDPGSNLSPSIQADICFAPSKQPGALLTPADVQCFNPNTELPNVLNLAKLQNRDNVLFTSGFETGDTTDWSGVSP